MISKYPKNFARFYDIIYHSMRDSVDSEYFQTEIKNTSGKVLEIGVGTGRLFISALEGGSDIYGLDISEEMLDVLYKKLRSDQHHRITLQNLIDFTFDFKFELIIAPFRVMMHVIDKADQIKAIDNVYDHLKSNGKFIFDAFIPDLSQLIKGNKNQLDFESEYETGHKIRRYVSTVPDLINQTIMVNFNLEWEESGELKSDSWMVPLRFFFRYELEHLLERTKFEKYKIYGDYQGNELNKESRDFIIVCQKNEK